MNLGLAVISDVIKPVSQLKVGQRVSHPQGSGKIVKICTGFSAGDVVIETSRGMMISVAEKELSPVKF